MKDRITKKLLCAILALQMIILCNACGSSPEEKNSGSTTTTAAAVTTTDTTPAETGDPAYTDELPALNFNNEEISIISLGTDSVKDLFACENPNGEIINDAVYKRNLELEERLGIKMKTTLVGTGNGPSCLAYVTNESHKCISAGDDSYDIVIAPSYKHVAYIFTGDYIDLNTVDYIDLDKSYWIQGFNDLFSYGSGDNKCQYLATGAYAITMFRYMFSVMYNRQTFIDHNIEDPTQTVFNGKWTLDYMYDVSTQLYSDLNGDGQRNDGDFFGFVGGQWVSIDPYWVASETKLIRRDSDGRWAYDATTVEKLGNVVDKIQKLYNSKTSYIYSRAADDSDTPEIVTKLAKGESAMATILLYALESYARDTEVDYGILPIPKYDESQNGYHTYIQDQVSVLAIASTVNEDRLPMVGAFCEGLSALSYKYVVDAYYENALSYKYLRDASSKKMLDLMYESVECDFVGICSDMLSYNIRNNLRPLVSSGVNTVSSAFKALEKILSKSVSAVNDNYDKLLG